ncbi:MAG: hypothetical protein EA398_09605 [Deltaproteobacteria bacterium]|nr:MAG: hypothetical protein EA398_09605 [Deltaproteobacteria bacterium]
MSDFPALFQLNRRDAATGLVERVPAMERVNALLAHPEAQRIVRQMDAQSLHDLIVEHGLSDSSELIQLCSAEQQRAFLDFSMWRRDRLEHEELERWLEVFLQLEDGELDQFLDSLDPEVLPLWLREHVGVLFWEHDQDLLDAVDAPLMSSPDGVYALVVPDEERIGPLLRLLLERVYSLDMDRGRRLLETVRWELSAQLEEQAHEARWARLQDLGFPSPEQAPEIIAWLDPGVWRRRIRERALSAETPPIVLTAGSLPVRELHLQRFEAAQLGGEQSVFIRALGGIGQVFPEAHVEPTADAILSQFRALANHVHVLDGADAGEISGARQAVATAERRLSIALELVAGDELPVASRALGTVPLKLLHRLGYSATQRLRQTAVGLARRGRFQHVDPPFSLLDPEEQDRLRGLLQPEPRLGESSAAVFRRVSEIEEAARLLARMAAVELVLLGQPGWSREQLLEGFTSPAEDPLTPIELLSLRGLVCTQLLRGDLRESPAPVPMDELRGLLSVFVDAAALQTALLERAEVWLDSTAVEDRAARILVSDWITGAIARLGDELGSGCPAQVDDTLLLTAFAVGGGGHS